MAATTVHCPQCGEQLVVEVIVHRIVAPPKAGFVHVGFQDAEVSHRCPTAMEDRLHPERRDL